MVAAVAKKPQSPSNKEPVATPTPTPAAPPGELDVVRAIRRLSQGGRPFRASYLRDALGIDAKDESAKGKMNYVIRSLVLTGVLGVSSDPAQKRNRLYRVVDVPRLMELSRYGPRTPKQRALNPPPREEALLTRVEHIDAEIGRLAEMVERLARVWEVE